MKFSNAEKIFIEVLKNLECISMVQASTILKKCCDCSTGQTTKIIYELAARDYLHITDDGMYILAGGKNGKFSSALNRNTITGLYIVLDVMTEKDNISWVRKDSSGADIKFVMSNVICRLACITADDIYKIQMMQEDYERRMAGLKGSSAENTVKEMAYFVFPKSVSEDSIFEKLEGMNLTIPHSLIFLKDDYLDRKPNYVTYSQ